MSDLTRAEQAEVQHLALYGGELAHFGAVQVQDAGPQLPVSVACGFGTAPLDALPETEAFYTARHLPARLVLYSHADPGSWARLARRGYTLTRLLHVYTRPLDAELLFPALLTRPADLDEFARVATAGFGEGSRAIMALTARRARTQLWVCELEGGGTGGEAAAAGALSVLDDAALLFSAATRPECRGRGAQTALLWARLQAACTAGADLAAVLTTPGSASERNVQRAGFALTGARLSFER